MSNIEQVYVSSLEVVCDGDGSLGNHEAGHPKVYLQMDQEKGEVTCPYCSRTYILKLSSTHK